jgi:hypothetical protein
MNKRNSPGSKYVSSSTNKIRSRSASSGRTSFSRGADSENIKVPDVPNRDLKTTSFQNRRAEFGINKNLNEEQ